MYILIYTYQILVYSRFIYEAGSILKVKIKQEISFSNANPIL